MVNFSADVIRHRIPSDSAFGSSDNDKFSKLGAGPGTLIDLVKNEEKRRITVHSAGWYFVLARFS